MQCRGDRLLGVLHNPLEAGLCHLIGSISIFILLSFHNFYIFSQFNLLFFCIFHIILLFSSLFFRIFHIFSLFNLPFLYGRKASWIVKRYGKCGRKVGWIVKRFVKYRRKLWNDMEHMDEMWNDVENNFPYIFTIQLLSLTIVKISLKILIGEKINKKLKKINK
jgi:hypothetical protein